MDTQQAKLILESFRPGGSDARDPHFSEALRCVGSDPELRRWFEDDQARDAAIRAKLRVVTVPAGLRERILAAKDSPSATAANPLTRRLALAASVVLIGVLAGMWFSWSNRSRPFSDCRAELVQTICAPFRLDFRHTDPAQIQSWLARRQQLPDDLVPTGLKSKTSIGCRTLRWAGRPVALLCFGGPGQPVVHVFVVPRRALTDPPGEQSPQFASVEGWTTASWTRGDVVYVMASQQSAEALEKLL